MREAAVYSLSFLLTGLVIGNAFHQKKQFYPAVVYLTKSSPSLAVLAFQSLVFVVLLGKLAQKIFFGHLRAAEVEHLIERSWYAVTETCLAFTVFRDDFGAMFVAMFTMLLFFKCFHWLAEDRVDYMERSPVLGVIFHSRVVALISLLGLADLILTKQAYLTTLEKGASVQLVFGFEYSILLTIVFTILVKYILHCIDLYDENPWENKAVYLLYLELLTGAIKLLLYTVFVIIMTKVHTFPLFAIRPLYITIRSFKKAVHDVVMSRRAIRNMNQLYPDATEEDLQTVDVCIICREQMVVGGGCKKLPCNHIFHASCLRSWFQRQQTCPTCRMEVLSVPPTRTTPVPAAAGGAIPRPAPLLHQAPAAAQQPPAPGQAPAAGAADMGPFAPNPWQAFNAGMAAGAQNRAQPPPTTSANQSSPSASTPTTAANQGAGNAHPLYTLPPFPIPDINQIPPFSGTGPAGTMPNPMFPFMPMQPLPMPPPVDLASLTEEELRQMERDDRESLLARIQWLRDIKTLLDSAVEQMNQYTMVMSVLASSQPQFQASTVPTTPPSGADHTTTSRPQATDNISANTQPSPIQNQNNIRQEDGSSSRLVTSTESRQESYQGARPRNTSPTALSSAADESDGQQATSSLSSGELSDAEEVRRRRLARFTSTDSGGNSS